MLPYPPTAPLRHCISCGSKFIRYPTLHAVVVLYSCASINNFSCATAFFLLRLWALLVIMSALFTQIPMLTRDGSKKSKQMALSIGLDFVDGTQTSIHPFCKLDFQTDSYNKWDKSSTFWEISHSSDVLTLITCEQLIMMICLKQNLKADNITLPQLCHSACT